MNPGFSSQKFLRALRHASLRAFHGFPDENIARQGPNFCDEFKKRAKVIAELKACGSSKNLRRGKKIHEDAIERGNEANIYVASGLIHMYAKCGSLGDACGVFEKMQYRDVVLWNTLIAGYAECGECAKALDLFVRMRDERCSPSARTFVSVLRACTDLASNEGKSQLVETGKVLHLLSCTSGYDLDIFVGNTLVDMYSKCGCCDNVRAVFEGMECRDVVTWTALILGHVDNGESEIALDLFYRMINENYEPEARTFVAVFKACSEIAEKEDGNGKLLKIVSFERGRRIHLLACLFGCDADIFVGNTLLDMYAKCGFMTDGRLVFENMHYRNVISWNALILGYADNGESKTALDMFLIMRRESCTPDARTFLAALKACGILGATEFGKEIYAELCKLNLQNNVALATTLVDFHTKCGNLFEARRVFDSQGSKDVVTWNALLGGYSRHGDTKAVFDLFDVMRDKGLQPSRVTFLCVLSACSHSGDVDKGRFYFGLMNKKYGVEPDLELYTCMVDLLGRANKLEDAMVLCRSMHLTPNAVIWKTILGACSKWQVLELGNLAYEAWVSFDANNATPYVCMASIYRDLKV